MFHVAVLGHGEDDEHEQYVLAGADELRVGKTLFVVKDEGTDAAERAEVGKHRTRDIGAAVEPARKFPCEEQGADGSQDKHEQKGKYRDRDEAPGDWQYPETQKRQDGVDADDVKADELVDGFIRNEVSPVQAITDGQRCDEVSQHENKPQIGSVHGTEVTSFQNLLHKTNKKDILLMRVDGFILTLLSIDVNRQDYHSYYRNGYL